MTFLVWSFIFSNGKHLLLNLKLCFKKHNLVLLCWNTTFLAGCSSWQCYPVGFILFWILSIKYLDTEAIARPCCNGQKPPFSFWSGQVHPCRMEKKATGKAGGLQVFSQRYLLWPQKTEITHPPFQSVLRPFISGREKPSLNAYQIEEVEQSIKKAAELQDPRNRISMSFPGITDSFHENFCQAAEWKLQPHTSCLVPKWGKLDIILQTSCFKGWLSKGILLHQCT